MSHLILLNTIKAKSAVLTVGHGRGFLIESLGKRVVVTAAHCLPKFPPPRGASYLHERTYGRLLGPLAGKRTVWAECLFADPIADIAVLGSPNNLELSDEADRYDALVDPLKPLRIAAAPENGIAWLLSLKGDWFKCTVSYLKRIEGPLWVSPDQPIAGGMSGSPILSDDGKAIGVVCLGGNHDQYGYPNPRLVCDLPARFLRPRRIPIQLTAEEEARIAKSVVAATANRAH